MEKAIEDGDLSLCSSILLSNPSCINEQNENGWTPLHCACYYEQISIVKFLLKNNADCYIKNKCGEIPFNMTNNWAIHSLLKGIDPFKDISPLFQLYRNGGSKKVISEIEKWELEYKNNHKNISYSEWISRSQYYPLIHGVKLDGESLLHIASYDNQINLVKKLILCGINVNIQRADGWTPLHAAASCGNDKICKILMLNKANPMIENNLQRTALFYAKNDPLTLHLIQSENKRNLDNTQWFTKTAIAKSSKYTQVDFKEICLYPGVYQFKLFSKRFCSILSSSVTYNSPLWMSDYGANISDNISWYFLDMITDSKHGVLSKFFNRYFPQYKHLKLHTATILGIRSKEDQNVVCPSHVDDSDITVNICIHKKDLKGSKLIFDSNENKIHIGHKVGYCIVHSGLLSHSVNKIEQGERINLILWLKVKPDIKIDNINNKQNNNATNNQKSLLFELSNELLTMILKHLNFRDLISMSSTCKYFYLICSSDYLWKSLVIKHFPLILVQSKSNYKLLFQQQLRGLPRKLILSRSIIEPRTTYYQYAIIGDSKIGKTSLLFSFLYEIRKPNDFNPKTCQGYNRRRTILGHAGLLQILDFHTETFFEDIRHLEHLEGLFLCYSIYSRESFIQVSEYLDAILHQIHKSWIPIILIGIKDDRNEDDRVVSKEEGNIVSSWFNSIFMEVNIYNINEVKQIFSKMDEIRLTSIIEQSNNTTQNNNPCIVQ